MTIKLMDFPSGISGVYKIENKLTGDIYIGSSVDIKKRWCSHQSSFGKDYQHCMHLNNAIIKYSVGNFKFKVVATCHPRDIYIVEQMFIDMLEPRYNINTTVYPHIIKSLPKKERRNTVNINVCDEYFKVFVKWCEELGKMAGLYTPKFINGNHYKKMDRVTEKQKVIYEDEAKAGVEKLNDIFDGLY